MYHRGSFVCLSSVAAYGKAAAWRRQKRHRSKAMKNVGGEIKVISGSMSRISGENRGIVKTTAASSAYVACVMTYHVEKVA